MQKLQEGNTEWDIKGQGEEGGNLYCNNNEKGYGVLILAYLQNLTKSNTKPPDLI